VTVGARVVAATTAALALLWMGGPAAAQDTTSTTTKAPTEANVDFEVGRYGVGGKEDWPIDALIVSGDMDDNTTLTVTVKGEGGRVIWTDAIQYFNPSTRVPVTGVGVGDVQAVEVSSALVAGAVIQAQLEEPSVPGGGGSTGQVATSMSLVIIVAVILFRTPLPAAATQRWTK
jgi:hypothetical protein